MASFGTTDLLNKAKTTVTDYLGISSTADVAASPIWTSRNTASDYFMVTVKSSEQEEQGLSDIKFKLPESFKLGLKSTFSSLVEGKLGIVSALNKVIQTASAVSGSMVSLNTKYTTAQLWEGSSPVSITLPIEFNAINNVNADVYDNVVRLSRMALPREGNEGDWTDIFLRAPGPTPLDLSNDKFLQGLHDEKTLKSNYDSVDGAKWLNEDIKKGLKNMLGWLASNTEGLQERSKKSGDNIKITIGNILEFERCIIPDITWDFDCTRLLNGSGLPMRVTGNMTFMTTTAMTAGDFAQAMKRQNTEFSLSDTWNKISKDSKELYKETKTRYDQWMNGD